MIAKKISSLLLVMAIILVTTMGFSQSSRVGSTSASFLEIGFGSAGSAMGEAVVSTTEDLGSVYWNPAGLGYMDKTEAQFTIQPWVVGINTSFTGVGLVLPRVGTLALSVAQVNYGDMKVTNLEMQEGTGEIFTASDMAIAFSFGRKLAQWFAFGASAKYVSSKIWHESASAMAIDLGVKLDTNFFSPSGERTDGMSIGMSISNYGTKMRFDGMDLLEPIDILPDESGNYRDTKGQFNLESWELPLIFRVGVAIHPIATGNHRVTIAMDALHPNNNTESVNVGAQYQLSFPRFGDFFIRGGYKALFMDDSEYGPTFGGGCLIKLMGNTGVKLDYCYKNMGLFGNTHSYTIGILF
jgi:hypothetical protein